MGSAHLIAIQKLEAKDYDALKSIHDGFCPNPSTSAAFIAFSGGEIIGRIFLLAPTHVEGPWIREDHRSGLLLKRLVDSAEREAKSCGITTLFAYGVSDETELYLKRLKFNRLHMTVWSKEI